MVQQNQFEEVFATVVTDCVVSEENGFAINDILN